MKKLGVDYVFLVAHLGMNGITPRWSSLAVAQNTQGIDAIIDGHSHEVIPTFITKNKQGKMFSSLKQALNFKILVN